MMAVSVPQVRLRGCLRGSGAWRYTGAVLRPTKSYC